MNGHPAGDGPARGPGDSPILIVDDDAQIRRFLHLALEDEGFAVATVPDGLAAVAWLARQRPALLLLDISLPGVDGTAVATHLRAHHGPGVPIVVLTADGRAAEKAARVGAIAFFHKPFDLPRLIAALRQALGDL